MHTDRLKIFSIIACIAFGLIPERGEAQRFGESDIASSSAVFAQKQVAPSAACAGSGFTGGRGKVLCSRRYAIQQLQQISALADQSRLYRPSRRANWADGAVAIYDIDNVVTARGYVAQQLSRAQVLTLYAKPYLRYLQASNVGVETGAELSAVAFWQNTADEIRSHAEFKNPQGAVAQLEELIVLRITGLSNSNCASRMGDGSPEAEFGNDWFSNQRHDLLLQSRAVCADRTANIASQTIVSLLSRFNRELSGRYPFASQDSAEADADTVKRFLIDYRAQRETLLNQTRLLPKAQRKSVDQFFEQLDGAYRQWGRALGVDAAPEGIPMRVEFRALTGHALHEDQIVQWAISTADQDVQYPAGVHRPLTWTPGHSIGVRFVLADRSQWTALPDPAQRDLISDGKSVAFVQTSPWALLKLIQSHRPRELPATLPGLPPRYWLEFKFPLEDEHKRQSTARVYISLTPDMPLPPALPTIAPMIW